MKKENLLLKLMSAKPRSKWQRGVFDYAIEMIDACEYDSLDLNNVKKILLRGAEDWNQYSWGGYSLIYNYDIAKRLCTPSELKRTNNGFRNPNHFEEWLDTQARAICQAYDIIRMLLREGE